MLIPAPRVESLPCLETACDGVYVPYGDGLLVCYQGHVSSLTVDDLDPSVCSLVPVLEEC